MVQKADYPIISHLPNLEYPISESPHSAPLVQTLLGFRIQRRPFETLSQRVTKSPRLLLNYFQIPMGSFFTTHSPEVERFNDPYTTFIHVSRARMGSSLGISPTDQQITKCIRSLGDRDESPR